MSRRVIIGVMLATGIGMGLLLANLETVVRLPGGATAASGAAMSSSRGPGARVTAVLRSRRQKLRTCSRMVYGARVMSNQRGDDPLLVELTSDPKLAEKLGEALEQFREVARSMGGAQPLIEALSASFGLMSDPKLRSEYDELRRVIVRYLESVDGDGLETASCRGVKFEESPPVTDAGMQALARLAQAAPKKSE